MKITKNINLLLRLILIPCCLLFITYLIIRASAWLSGTADNGNTPASTVTSFGIAMPAGYTVFGIDVSKHQGNIDWKRVSRMSSNGIKLDFVFIKATEGITRQDHKFETNWNQARQNGILRGAYHFYYPSRDADMQADNFIKVVKLTKGDLPPVVDIEYSNGKTAKKICTDLKVFIERIEKQYDVKPIIYTNINFYNTYLVGSFDDYPLWIAGYFDHDRFYNEFTTPWILWQHSERGKVDGIRGNVDFNVFKGSLEKLEKMRID